MWRTLFVMATLFLTTAVSAQTMTFSTSNTDYQVTNVFSDVDTFSFSIVIDAPLAPGVYDNPDIISVDYSVGGDLAAGTPSGFTTFALARSLTGEDFYAQGSSLSFEISAAAVLTDGVQVAELVGADVVFTFNGRENDNGRFHPALFELRADGTGRIQNSDNIVTLNPLQQVEFGEEYINDLMFDGGNTTLLTVTPTAPAPIPVVDPPVQSDSGGGGSVSLLTLFSLLLLLLVSLRFRILVVCKS